MNEKNDSAALEILRLPVPQQIRSGVGRAARFLLRGSVTLLKPVWTWANESALGIHTIPKMQHRDRAPRSPGWWRGEHADTARHDDNFAYATIDYWNVRKMIDALRPGPEDVFYDIGCGMGRIVCLMAQRPIKRSVGIELFAPLCRVARTNAERLRGRKAPIEIVCADAASADFSGGTIYCMFNPFGEQTLRDTLENLRHSVAESARRITIVYYNPTCEYVLAGAGWLEKIREFRIFGGHSITFWQNRGGADAAISSAMGMESDQ